MAPQSTGNSSVNLAKLVKGAGTTLGAGAKSIDFRHVHLICLIMQTIHLPLNIEAREWTLEVEVTCGF